MRRPIAAVLLLGSVAVLVIAAPAVSSGAKRSSPEARCKFVTKLVKGHRKRVKVCKAKPKPKPPGPRADLTVSIKPSLDRITAGNQLLYDVKVENLGPEPAAAVEVSVAFPADSEAEPGSIYAVGSEGISEVACEGSSEEGNGPFVWHCKVDQLQPRDTDGEAGTPSLRLSFVAEPEHGGPFAVEAKAEAGTKDSHPENNRATASIDVSDGPASADLSVAVQAAPDPATVPDDFVETVRVTNHGPTEATSVRTTVLLPLGVELVDVRGPTVSEQCPYSYALSPSTVTLCWSVLQPGDSAEAKITLAPTGTAPPTLETNLVVSTYTPDPDLADNRAAAATPVAPFHPSPGVDLVAFLYAPQLQDEGEEHYVVVPFGLGNRGAENGQGAHLVLIASGPVEETGFGFSGPFNEPPTGPCERTDSGTIDCVVRSLESGLRVSGFFYAKLAGTGPLKVTLTAIPAAQDANPADNTASVSFQGLKSRALR
jgi:Domain of unknown function DUF11